jgi:hypothetical protein
VDVEVEKGVDRVHHDGLMGGLATRIEDTRRLRRSRYDLEAGVMANGVAVERHEGTPQGGPLSPWLANALLDDVDTALERRGHAFVRYADDGNVSGRSRTAGERGLVVLRKTYGPLRLRINEDTSAVGRVITRQVLGLACWRGAGGKLRRRVADTALDAMKDRVREITGRSRGRRVAQVVGALTRYLTGWWAYVRMAETPAVFRRLNEWIRHRLRPIDLTPWKTAAASRELRARGAPEALATRVGVRCHRWWSHSTHTVHVGLTNRHVDELGVSRLAT